MRLTNPGDEVDPSTTRSGAGGGGAQLSHGTAGAGAAVAYDAASHNGGARAAGRADTTRWFAAADREWRVRRGERGKTM